MKYFLWKIAGADCDLLKQSGKDSQNSFWLIGLLYLLINLLTYLGFFGLFWGVFDKILPTFIGTTVLGFLVTNIYRLNLISLEPHTLPVKAEIGSLIFTNIIRYSTVILFAFFVSKSVEMVIVNVIESAGFIDYDGSKGYMNHMSIMNRTQPWLWIITTGVIIVFIAPIYLRHRLNRAHEYYLLRRVRDKDIVKLEHQKHLKLKEEILRKIYFNYRSINNRFFEDSNAPFYNRENLPKHISEAKAILAKREFKSHKKKYTDEPFNTKEITLERKLKSSEEFLNTILSKS